MQVFKFLHYNNEERLPYMSYQLQGSVDYWWDARQKTYTHDQVDILMSEQFKKALYEKYIPRKYQKQNELEFFNLKQGKKSVSDYKREFCDLAWFVYK